MSRHLAILFFFFFLLTDTSFSADREGGYYMGGGAGGVKCPDFVASMEKGRSLGVGSIGYVHKTSVFTMYLLGFQTGYNLAADNVYDIFHDKKDHYELLSWIEQYCLENPSKNFGHGVVALSEEQRKKIK